MPERDQISLSILREAASELNKRISVSKKSLEELLPAILFGLNYDNNPRFLEADDQGILIGTRPAGELLIGQISAAASGIGDATVSIQPPVGEVWIIELVSVQHDAAAAKEMTMYKTDGSASRAFIMGEDGMTVTEGKETPVYPQFYDDPTGDVFQTLGTKDMLVNNNIYLELDLLAPGAGKILKADFTYRRVRY